MVSKSEFNSSGPKSLPVIGEYKLPFQFLYCKPSVKYQWNRGRKFNFVTFGVLSALIVGGE